MRNKLFDILFVPAYLEGHFFLKAIFAAVYVLFKQVGDLVRIPMLLSVNIMLLLLNMRENPCAVKEINILRTATLSGTVWAGIASLLFVTQLQSTASDCGGKGFLLLLFLTGWVMIFSGATYIGYFVRQPVNDVLAHTFLELERQVEAANKAGRLGPLVGIDRRPILLNGSKISIRDAIRDWPSTSKRIKANAVKQARQEAAERVKQKENRKIGSWNIRERARTLGNMVTHRPVGDRESIDLDGIEMGARKRGSVSEMLGASTSKGLISDDELSAIYALNVKVLENIRLPHIVHSCC
jgi:hypothetical protein